ncbi:MAG: hypothetical protein H0U74_17140 [Bradymonadaceae bacterium]|nr:hypothetical protein [Lujinxingiaceae bacterium]
MAIINCSLCNAEEDVPFQPREGSSVLCRKCFKAQPKPAGPPKKHVPRTQHGTRVSLFIDCSECGKHDELDYVPKGTPMNEMLCNDCAAKRFGDASHWAEVSRAKESEARTEWAFICDDCGREDYLKFAPMASRTYQCNRCFSDQEVPAKERLQDKAKLESNVFIRKRSDT